MTPPDDPFPAVYAELRRLAAAKLAHEPAGHTLDATALVHEAYLRLGGDPAGRSRFVAAAAEAMRRILIDHARKKRAGKRGGAARRFTLSDADRVNLPDPDVVLDVDAALSRLAADDPAAAAVARLRLFAGRTVDEAAAAVGVSRATAYRDWSYARAWLTAALADGVDGAARPE
ncbi:MAG: RNA polymerase subunit sigma [Gemmataceae bacterium]|nr:RNA polymerase subunit sigma [Gemmataceae bacterium]